MNINLDKLRNIGEVKKEGILVKILWSYPKEIYLRKAKGAILNSFKGKLITDFRNKNDPHEVVDVISQFTRDHTVSYIH